jgi:hypothetical protein
MVLDENQPKRKRASAQKKASRASRPGLRSTRAAPGGPDVCHILFAKPPASPPGIIRRAEYTLIPPAYAEMRKRAVDPAPQALVPTRPTGGTASARLITGRPRSSTSYLWGTPQPCQQHSPPFPLFKALTQRAAHGIQTQPSSRRDTPLPLSTRTRVAASSPVCYHHPDRRGTGPPRASFVIARNGDIRSRSSERCGRSHHPALRFFRPAWRNGRRRGLKILFWVTRVWVRIPPPAVQTKQRGSAPGRLSGVRA